MSPPGSVHDASHGGEEFSSADVAVDSLGEALAGMAMASKAPVNFSGSSAPFSLGSGPAEDGWGNFSDPSAMPYNHSEAKAAASDHYSVERFLSQSPSQTLGEDVFKLSHTNLPKLEEAAANGDFAFAPPNLAPGPSKAFEVRRRNDSPSCSVTGTTSSSRSASPYNGSEGRTIQAYQRYEAADESFSMNRSFGSQPSLATLDSGRSPFASRDRNFVKQVGPSYLEPGLEATQRSLSNPSFSQGEIPANGGGGQQVLYMAVPSPDGRGQVLQPVQMMQLPGKPYHYVVPGANGNAPAEQPIAMPQRNEYAQQQDNRAFARSNNYGYGESNGFEAAPAYGRNEEFSKTFGAGDPAIANLYNSPQRPSLDSLLGQVRRLSRDQVGCRLVQQALDEEGPEAATQIFNEGLPFWGEAMVDPFGNYLFQKVLEKITPAERIVLVRSVSARLVNASLNLHGTRSVQKVVELCATDLQVAPPSTPEEETAASILTQALAPAAARLCIDSHGNHVIQRILLKLDHSHARFVFDAVANSVGDVARHRHGCCVIQRCLDSKATEARSHLVKRIVEKSLELMQDAYGNYVVQYVLDVCSDDDVQLVCEAVVGKVNLLAIQKFSSNVMEKCLERCSDHVKDQYLQEMSDPDRVRELMMDPFGNYVVQRALSVATHAQAIRLVEAMKPHLMATTSGGIRNGGVRNTAGGRRIIAKICRRFPNFNVNAMGPGDDLYSQNRGHHDRYQHQGSGMVNYAPMGAPSQQQQQRYAHDPRMGQGQYHVPQQQSYYNMGGAGHYDNYSTGYGGYSGM